NFDSREGTDPCTQVHKLFSFPAAPTINGLFGIAHNGQTTGALFFVFSRKPVRNERLHIFPLQYRSVLKFIDKIVAVTFPKSFIVKWHGLTLDTLGYFFVKIGDE